MGTSAVGIKYKLSSVTKYICPSLSGNCPVPYADCSFTIKGGTTSKYPACTARSKKKEAKARCKRAPFPKNTGNPAPVSCTPNSKLTKLY